MNRLLLKIEMDQFIQLIQVKSRTIQIINEMMRKMENRVDFNKL